MLSTIRKFMIQYRVGAFMGITILFFSCTKDKTLEKMSTPQVSEDLTSVTRVHDASDNDVFKAVMFLEGPLSQKLDAFKDFNLRMLTHDNDKIKDALDFQDMVIEKLLLQNENYLSEFRANIGSGDFHLVEATLKSTGSDILRIALAATDASEQQIADAELFANQFMKDNDLNENSSIQEIRKAVNLEAAKGSVVNVHYIAAFSWLFAAAAAVIVIVIFAATSKGTVNSYLYNSYLSSVTLDFKNI